MAQVSRLPILPYPAWRARVVDAELVGVQQQRIAVGNVEGFFVAQ